MVGKFSSEHRSFKSRGQGNVVEISRPNSWRRIETTPMSGKRHDVDFFVLLLYPVLLVLLGLGAYLLAGVGEPQDPETEDDQGKTE
jgi:hypothetical protein